MQHTFDSNIFNSTFLRCGWLVLQVFFRYWVVDALENVPGVFLKPHAGTGNIKSFSLEDNCVYLQTNKQHSNKTFGVGNKLFSMDHLY